MGDARRRRHSTALSPCSLAGSFCCPPPRRLPPSFRSRTATSGSWPATASRPSTCTRTTSRRSASPAIPKLKFAFRNSGVGGHTIPSTLARFDYDIAAWKPTVVSVELGMNDKGGTPTDKFIANMGTMVERIRSIKARPVIFAASPVNNGETMAKLGGNRRLHEYAVALKEFAAKEQIPYADQFHALLDIWGKNKPRETVANSISP